MSDVGWYGVEGGDYLESRILLGAMRLVLLSYILRTSSTHLNIGI